MLRIEDIIVLFPPFKEIQISIESGVNDIYFGKPSEMPNKYMKQLVCYIRPIDENILLIKCL